MTALPLNTATPEPAKVLIVDDDAEVRSVLEAGLAGFACSSVACGSAGEAQQEIRKDRFAVVLSDIRMPDMSGLELLHHIRDYDTDISVIMITGVNEIETALEAMRLGACDYITKPFDLVRLRRSLLQAVERNSLLVENRHYQQELEQKVLFRTQGLNQALKEVEDSYRVTLEALVTALDAREHETHSHSKRVCAYTERLARQLGVNGSALVEIGRGALLHDVGKIGVPDSILLKPARLTDAEWRVMKRHPRTGHDILGGIRFLSAAAEIVLSHQERWDGHGYPQGLAGKDIPIGARIFAVVDTLDAMTSDRPYRKALSFQAAIEEIRRCSGTQFDPCIVDAFLSIPAPNWVEIHDALNTEDALRNPFALLCRT